MIFGSRIAIFEWVFSILWIGGVVGATYLVIRDGSPVGVSETLSVAVLIFFWIGVIILIRFACGRACTTVRVLSEGAVAIVVRYPHKVIRRTYQLSDLTDLPRVVETQDSDGDPYFRCELTVGPPFNEPICLAEGCSKEQCEVTCSRFNRAISQTDAS